MRPAQVAILDPIAAQLASFSVEILVSYDGSKLGLDKFGLYDPVRNLAILNGQLLNERGAARASRTPA